MIHYMTSNGIGNAWVANELHALQEGGVPFRLHSMRPAGSTYHLSEWARTIERETNVLYPLSVVDVVKASILSPIVFGRRFWRALMNAFFGERESFRGRLAAMFHLLVASVWALGLRNEEVSHIHSQWIHSGGTIAMYGAWLLGRPFSFTGHATDLFRDRVALKDKIRRAEFIVCISEFHRAFFLNEGARPEQLHIVYCGIDPTLFTMRKLREREEGEKVEILSTGRLVEKKGFSDLIRACAVLRDRGFSFHCTIGGSGELEKVLREEIRRLDLDEWVSLTGESLKQEKIPEFMADGDVYCLPCVWASDNDVDGLPQMLMEAMACGVPAISTRLVGIPDLVIDGETGLLVEPGDPEEIADAIEKMMGDREMSEKMRVNGRNLIEERFNLRTCLEPLIGLYRQQLERAGYEVGENATNQDSMIRKSSTTHAA